MKKHITIIIATAILITVFLLPASALARSGSVNVSAAAEAYAGEYVSVSITASADGDSIGTFQADISYDKSLLEYVSGGGNSTQIGSGSGAISYTGSADDGSVTFSLRFRALAAGSADIAVTYYISGYDSGATLADGSTSARVSISAERPSPSPTDSEAPQPSESPDPTEPLYFEHDGTMYRVLEYVPENVVGLTISSGVFNGVSVPSAYFASNSSNAYFFAENALYPDTSETLLYSAQTNSFVPYLPVSGGGTYIILEWERPLPGFPEDAAAVFEEPLTHNAGDEFILVSAVAPDGVEGYYFYDTLENTMQRAVMTED